LFRDAQGKAHSLFLSGIAVSLCEGIYRAVETACTEERIPRLGVQDVGSLFGYLFEEYALDLLDETFPGRVLRKPHLSSTVKNEAADAVIICPEGIIVVEVKGRHVRATKRLAWKDAPAKEEDVIRTGLIEAVDQLAKNLPAFRKGLVPGVPFTSGSDFILQPVTLTYESVPRGGMLLPLVRSQRARVSLDSHTRPLVMMDVTELEAVCSLPPRDTIWGVLTEFISSGGWEERNLKNFLHDTDRLYSTAMLSRWTRIMTMLSDKLQIRP